MLVIYGIDPWSENWSVEWCLSSLIRPSIAITIWSLTKMMRSAGGSSMQLQPFVVVCIIAQLSPQLKNVVLTRLIPRISEWSLPKSHWWEIKGCVRGRDAWGLYNPPRWWHFMTSSRYWAILDRRLVHWIMQSFCVCCKFLTSNGGTLKRLRSHSFIFPPSIKANVCLANCI